MAAIPGLGRTMATDNFPPLPAWKPSFSQPLERIAERFSYYTDGQRDFVVLQCGTCVLVDDGLSDAAAYTAARSVLDSIVNFHPDMNPAHMDDGNVMVRYNHPAFNVVLTDIAKANWQEIEARHKDGLTKDEVLITPLGPNIFDDFGKMALLGRSYMFMDALDPKFVEIRRHGSPANT